MVKRYKHKNTKKRLFLSVIALLVVVGIIFFVLEKTDTTSFFSASTDSEQEAQTTSELPSAQPDYNGGSAAEENKDPGNTNNENQGSAIVTDNNGAASTDTSKSLASASGEITVYLPHTNSVLKAGQEISGISTLPVVQYRLIDNISGVIATGSLKVVDGNFSGTLSFNTSANEGRLDIFATKSDASEFSAVEIPVRFK